MHIWSDVKVGQVAIDEGAVMASGDVWELTIKENLVMGLHLGKGGMLLLRMQLLFKECKL